MTTISWPAWGTTAGLSVTEPGALPAAQRLARAVIAHAEKAADRRNPHAELHRLDRAAGRQVRVSRHLAVLVAAGLDAARRTGGLVDPTVGNAVVLAGTTPASRPGVLTRLWRDTSWAPVCAGAVPARSRPAVGWQAVDLDGREVTVPAYVLLDLSAAGKAATVQHAADVIAHRLGIGVLVSLGGDLATAGPAPSGGWPVPGAAGALGPLACGAGQATLRRPVIDPRTGRPAARVWAATTVRCAADEGGLATAKALAVAAAVIGPAAPLWLDERGVRRDARLLVPPATGQLPLPRGTCAGTRASDAPQAPSGTARRSG
jgi:FAD:protein FMN transferase